MHGNGWGKFTLHAIQSSLPWDWKNLQFGKMLEIMFTSMERKLVKNPFATVKKLKG